MIFSKSFGYALCGTLYIAMNQKKDQFINAEEIAGRLNVPRHFMGKILKKLAKENILASVKGPFGGFALNDQSLSTPLVTLFDNMQGMTMFNLCAMRVRECDSKNPCPLHYKMEKIKMDCLNLLSDTTIGELLENKGNYRNIMKSISVDFPMNEIEKK